MNKKENFQVAIALFIVIFLFKALIPFITGSEKAFIVLSGSMTPLMLPRDMIIVKSVDPNELTVGDILTFRDPGGKPNTYVTHRIIALKEDKELIFKTKGDANNAEDNFNVTASKAVGKLVFVIPFAGYLPEITKNKNIFFFMIILPASLIIIGEIWNIILFNNPQRARKVERERKKTSKRTFYAVKGQRLVALILINGLVFTGIIICNSEENESVILKRENTVENSGFLSMVYVFTPDDPKQTLAIDHWYGVVPKNNETQVIAPENTTVKLNTVPYILPVFWILELTKINPDLPVAAEIVVYTSISTLVLFPIWYRKSTIRGRRKRIRFHRMFAQWKRTLRFVNL
ncbi:MAG: signal peptidase I [Methanosarcina sp.]|nr:signal peptidase I [Methanosarcina sp.]MDD4521463.1 signal peptidase I [Methanosarcina sp.]